jgi:D-glycero-D-manno-heptose 1,7-bisphosphate phosphatase
LKRAVFLDRDGVINEAMVKDGKPYPPGALQDLRILEGIREALLRLRQNGFLNLVVTNQPDVARGKTPRKNVEDLHRELAGELALDGFYTCWHDDHDGCNCRKPKAGLLEQAAREHQVDLGSSYMVGDRWRDVAAGRAAGCRTIFLDYGYAEKKPDRPDFVCCSLTEAVAWIEKEEAKR